MLRKRHIIMEVYMIRLGNESEVADVTELKRFVLID